MWVLYSNTHPFLGYYFGWWVAIAFIWRHFAFTFTVTLSGGYESYIAICMRLIKWYTTLRALLFRMVGGHHLHLGALCLDHDGNINVHVCLYKYICTSLGIDIYVHTYVRVHINIWYTNIYIYIYTHIYTSHLYLYYAHMYMCIICMYIFMRHICVCMDFFSTNTIGEACLCRHGKTHVAIHMYAHTIMTCWAVVLEIQSACDDIHTCIFHVSMYCFFVLVFI